MADATTRQNILADIIQRLGAITTANGFATDAGAALFFGETPLLGEGDADEAIAVIVRDDVPEYLGDDIRVVLPIDVQALAKADLQHPWMTVEAVIGDVKRAMEVADRGLDGKLIAQLTRGRTRALPRDPESTVIGAAVEYRGTYLESWGHP
jgi:hypothetical protein